MMRDNCEIGQMVWIWGSDGPVERVVEGLLIDGRPLLKFEATDEYACAYDSFSSREDAIANEITRTERVLAEKLERYGKKISRLVKHLKYLKGLPK